MARIPLAQVDPAGSFARDRGAGTVLPTTSLRRGDAYFHTGLSCLVIYNGTAWRQAHITAVADAAARTAISATYSALLHPGFAARQADTGTTWEWNGSGWDPPVPGGDVRYQLASGATVSLTASTDVVPPLATAIQTHADVTRSADNSTFTINRSGVWLLAAGYRVVPISTGGNRYTVTIVVAGSQVVQSDAANTANVPMDRAVSVPVRIAAGAVVYPVLHANATAANLDSAATAVNRTFFSAVFLRP